jgi:hypothetical protein
MAVRIKKLFLSITALLAIFSYFGRDLIKLNQKLDTFKISNEKLHNNSAENNIIKTDNYYDQNLALIIGGQKCGIFLLFSCFRRIK